MTKPHYRRTADGSTFRIDDGYRNLVANLGTERDKAAWGTYATRVLNPYELLEMYRGSALPRKIVDIPALDTVRKWRQWNGGDDQITAIEAEEKRLGVVEKVRDGNIAARLYGGGAIYINVGDSDVSQPLNPERVGLGGIRSLTVLTPMQLSPGEIGRDIESDTFGLPDDYRLTTDKGQYLTIHPSRLVIFTGASVPDAWMVGAGWGDSVLMSTLDAIRQTDSTAANIASLVFEAKVDVISIPGLMEMMESAAAEAAVTSRLALGARAKGVNGTLILDAGRNGEGAETYEQKSLSFGTLPDILDRFMILVSGAADIPVTRLFGRSAAGMNATGEGDERNYYDKIQAMQELEVSPAMAILDACLVRSATGRTLPDVYHEWRPLRQETAKERAEVFKMVADAARALIGNGGTTPELLPVEALSDALVNRLVEDGSLPGLEAAIDEFGRLADQEDETDGAEAAMTPPLMVPAEEAEQERTVSDAAPRTLYVNRRVVNADEIIAWAKAQGFETTLPADDLHVTIAFSRKPVDWMAIGEPWAAELTIHPGGPRLMERFGDAQVLLFASSELKWRHDAIREAGASWDHAEYQPHITISYTGHPDFESVQPYQGRIVLGPERFEEVKEDWAASLTEDQAE